jgi:GNAT superfamily N-acetyltransferase
VTNSELLVVRANATHVDQLREIRLLALRDEPDAYGSTFEETSRYASAQWLQMASQWNYYLAFRGEEVVGMASGGRYDQFRDARWLYGMFVRSDVRGSGVAQQLVARVAQWARQEPVSTLGLHVTVSLPRARAFYQRLGFVDTGRPAPMDRDKRLSLQMMTTDLSTNERI